MIQNEEDAIGFAEYAGTDKPDVELPRVLDISWVDEYKRSLDAIWHELVRLNSYLVIIREIASFPFHLFGYHDNRFWKLTFAAMAESCAMLIWRICLDTDDRVLSIRRFRNEIEQNIIDSGFKAKFRARCASIAFKKKLKSIGPRVKAIRHNRLAHFNREWTLRGNQTDGSDTKILLNELEETAKLANDLFQVLCIDHGRAMTYSEYNSEVVPGQGMDSRCDVERILDGIAARSFVLNMPEQQPKLWDQWRQKNLSPDDIEVLNKYRRKFCLPDMSLPSFHRRRSSAASSLTQKKTPSPRGR